MGQGIPVGDVAVTPAFVLIVGRVVSFVQWSNSLVAAHWPWLFGGAILMAGVVSLYKYREDLQWEETNAVSTAPLEGEEPVSVLVPAWEEGETIERSIEAFLELSYPHREMVVCAGGGDATYRRALAAAEGAERVQVLEQTDAMNKQAALNACLEEAEGEVLYLVDGDCVLDDGTWNAALRPVIEGDERVATGTSRPLDEQWGRLLPTYQHVKEEYERARRPRYVRGLLGRNAVLAREAMDGLGEFDESIQAGTDYNLAKRLLAAGEAIRFVPNSRVRSEYPETVRGYFAQQSRWLRNVFFLGREWGETGEARTTLVTCGIGTAMIGAPLAGAVWWPVLVGWVGLVSFGVLSRVRWIASFRRTTSRRVPAGVGIASPGLAMVEFAAWAFTVVELIVPSRRRKW